MTFFILYIQDSSDNTSMKEIKGLDERLISLQQRLILAKQFVQDQADMAQVRHLYTHYYF